LNSWGNPPGNHIPFYTAAILAFSLQPISMIFGISLGFHIFIHKYVKIAVIAAILLVIGDFILLFGYTDQYVSLSISPVDGLVVMILDSWLFVFMGIFIFTGFFFFCVRFYQLSKRVENPERHYLRQIALGWLLICIGGVTGAAVEGVDILTGVIILIGKILMTIGIILNYLGFLPSTGASKST